MSEIKRRTPEEMEIYFLSHISELTYEAKAFEDKAVEVLAKALCNSEAPTTGLFWDDASDDGNIRQHYRAEAKQLLGLDNNKEARDE
jgi:hypothetical protein